MAFLVISFIISIDYLLPHTSLMYVYCIISICISKKEDHCEKAGNNVIKARAVGAGGAGGVIPSPQILTDHLTLHKPGVSDYAHHNTTCPPPSGFLDGVPPLFIKLLELWLLLNWGYYSRDCEILFKIFVASSEYLI